jgi:hypothetical protein
MCNEIKIVIKSLLTKKSLDEFHKTFKEELMSVLLKLVHKIEIEGMLPNSFYGASITLIPKSDKDTTKL